VTAINVPDPAAAGRGPGRVADGQDAPATSRTTLALSDLPPTISVEEAAELLGISRSAAYRAAKAGQLATLRIGRKPRVPTAPLLRMLGR
jgi:excisionase family DNA binding protein